MAATEAQGNKLTLLVSLTGTCKNVKGKDRTAVCRGVLVNTDYSDNRTGFYFVTSDGLSITFSTQGNGQVKPDDKAVVSPVA